MPVATMPEADVLSRQDPELAEVLRGELDRQSTTLQLIAAENFTSPAVLAAYAALLRPGDTVLAMGLPFGGHLTHGSPANFSGRWFDFVGYGVEADSGLIDYEQVRA